MVKASSETVFLFMEVIHRSVIYKRNHTFAKAFCVLQMFGFWCFLSVIADINLVKYHLPE